ncbi:MAG: DnaJ domain-containing protein [Myxococcota bacterium]
MNLPGRLRSTTLGDLFGQLHRARADGILELVEATGAGAGRAHRVFFAGGLVDDVQTSLPAPRLGELLSRDGVVPREALGRLTRRLIAEPSRRAGEILVEEKLASGDDIVSGLRQQLRLRLEALFRLSEALIRFHVRSPRDAKQPRPAALEPKEFLHDRPRARRSRSERNENAEAYRALGLGPGADDDAVQRAFRRLARDVHPDRHPDASPEERARLLSRFAELSQAYHALTR